MWSGLIRLYAHMHTHTYCRPTLKVAITTDDKVKMQNKRKIYSYALSYLILSARGAVSVVALAFSLPACVGHLSTGERGCSHSHFKTTVSKFPLEERARMYNYIMCQHNNYIHSCVQHHIYTDMPMQYCANHKGSKSHQSRCHSWQLECCSTPCADGT